ncbi:PEPxxWA-CTERM sorting domain-containing protein [Altererythrobacter aurantiacus]|uniref:PEPxxWA-CTERM sorting domain-containing protein n=1 Tax=Parapontixanthobacter aurantiacus TaxID=1463599 RepID=A0A844ZDE4_9SPHN|nr:NF038132 family protein [Parapontixanthobacter aurantiacus]MXO85895.1 PEPxxWA-CTERM sorting domain-containing protein [Parapontixanthobacter aurantiacus]
MRKITLGALVASAAFAVASPAAAQTCVGECGSAAPNGDVTAPPEYGPNYSYVSTRNGQTGAGQIDGVGGTDGSEYTTAAFSASAGDELNFYFNYITSDGAGFADYAFAQLLSAAGDPVAYLFTARTRPTGDTSPGFGLPANSATLTPITSEIVSGAPDWAQLGGNSGDCFAAGCGYTGWINSSYTIGADGSYTLKFGVSNFTDTAYDSGLAFAGLTIAGQEIPTPGSGAVPEPATWMMLLLGFGAIGGLMRRRPKQGKTTVSFA